MKLSAFANARCGASTESSGFLTVTFPAETVTPVRLSATR